jgi:NDP-sugar pyrophosphorylase family protein
VTRWVYPLVPDSQVVNKDSSYVHLKQYSYREKDVIVARSVNIGDCVVIGKGSTIDENSIIQKTIIGPGCFIQDNVEIVDSHIWEGETQW